MPRKKTTIKTWIMPDASEVSSDDDLGVLEGALAEVQSMRDEWDAIACEIEDEISRREGGAQ